MIAKKSKRNRPNVCKKHVKWAKKVCKSWERMTKCATYCTMCCSSLAFDKSLNFFSLSKYKIETKNHIYWTIVLKTKIRFSRFSTGYLFCFAILLGQSWNNQLWNDHDWYLPDHDFEDDPPTYWVIMDPWIWIRIFTCQGK